MKLIWGMVLFAFVAPATADILLIEKVRERMLRDLPGNGLSMTEVEARFGAPLDRHAAVGQPPITRWVYEDYSVYFEHQLVIESVLHHEAVVRETRRRLD
ncbi:MAG: hypothetical protein EA370_00805 [Wenzhouxiangella sp.]|nr:MAG: hypothetical protein EA370_00805 [Wenzhouxiangella sp.]